MLTNVPWENLRTMLIRMRNRLNLILCSIAASLLAACHGNVDQDETASLLLSADRQSVPADGVSQVTFTVTYGSDDVTSQAEIFCVTTGMSLDANVFTATENGSYVFVAKYGSQESQRLEIEAERVSRFERNVCVMEFTGQWCSWCPDGAKLLQLLVSETYEGQAYALAFHNDDSMTIPAEGELKSVFGWTEYPSYVTDMRDCGSLSGSGCRMSIEKSLYETVTHSGVAVSCAGDGGKYKATAKLFSESPMEYRMAAYLVEDKVIAEQTVSGNVKDEDYVHRHVVRKMLSSSVSGDALGAVDEGEEVTRSYEFELDPSWNVQNMTVAVLAIDNQGYVNNMNLCAVNGGNADYEERK